MNSKQLYLLFIAGGISIIGSLFIIVGYESIWQLWNIPVMTPHFADLRSITGGAESAAMGFDPMYENPGDPWGRPMNYPRVWQILFTLGLNQSHTTMLGLLFIALFVVGNIIFVGKLNLFASICLMLGLFSPAILLGIERGNSDLFIFFLLALALSLVRTHAWLSMSLANIAMILKLFPVFGFVYLLGEDKKRSYTLLAVSLVVACLYLGGTYADVIQIGYATQKETIYSYGTNVIGLHLASFLQRPSVATLLFILITIGIIVILLPLLLIYAAKITKYVKAPPHLPALKLGAGIYIGTFMLGNNWDYRLIFLLFVVPQLVLWCGHVEPMIRWPARLTLCSVLLTWWAPFLLRPLWTIPLGDDIALVLDEGVNWLAFVGLFYLLLAALPTWLWQLLPRLLMRIGIQIEALDESLLLTEALP